MIKIQFIVNMDCDNLNRWSRFNFFVSYFNFLVLTSTGFCIIRTSVMKNSRRSSSTYTESLFLHLVKYNLLFFVLVFFFLSGFFLQYSRFTGQQVKWETISLYPFYHFNPLYRHLDISWVIAAESSPLRMPGSRNQTWNLWYTLFRIHSFLHLHWYLLLLGEYLKLG